MKWEFKKYLGDPIPEDLQEQMKAKGMKIPEPILALSNSGEAKVFSLTPEGEIDRLVASVECVTPYKRGEGHKAKCEERDKAAMLIAAAPELLAALRQCLTVLQSNPPAEKGGLIEGQFKIATENTLAAIAKAEGK